MNNTPEKSEVAKESLKPFVVNVNVLSKSEKGIHFSYDKSKLTDRLIDIESMKLDPEMKNRDENGHARAYVEVNSNENHSVVIMAENKRDAKERLKTIELAPTGANGKTELKLLGLLGKYGSVTELSKLSPDTVERIREMCDTAPNPSAPEYDVADAQNTRSVDVTSINELPPTMGKSNTEFEIVQEGILRERRRYALYYNSAFRDTDGIALKNLKTHPSSSDDKYLLVSADYTFDLETNYKTNDLNDMDRVSAPREVSILRLSTAKQEAIDPKVVSSATLDAIKEIVINCPDYTTVLSAFKREHSCARIVGAKPNEKALER